jgi:hypothetical protein
MNVSFDVDCTRYYLNKNPNKRTVGFISSLENRDVRVGDVRHINGVLWTAVFVRDLFPGWFSSDPKYSIEWCPVDTLPYEEFVKGLIEEIKKAYA